MAGSHLPSGSAINVQSEDNRGIIIRRRAPLTTQRSQRNQTGAPRSSQKYPNPIGSLGIWNIVPTMLCLEKQSILEPEIT